MDTPFAARQARASSMDSPLSDTLHTLLTPDNTIASAQYSYNRAQLQDSESCRTETASELLTRLRVADADLIQVHCTSDPGERHLMISRSLLAQISPVLSAKLEQHTTLEDSSQLYLDTDPLVFTIFVYWLFHQRVPQLGDFDGELAEGTREQDRGQFQILLVHCWHFAEKWALPRLQNELLKTFFHSFAADAIDARIFGACLEVSRQGSAMRFALIAYLLGLHDLHELSSIDDDENDGNDDVTGDNNNDGDNTFPLVDSSDFRRVDGLEEDLSLAMEVIDWQGRDLATLLRKEGCSMETTCDYVVGKLGGRARTRARPMVEKFYVAVD